MVHKFQGVFRKVHDEIAALCGGLDEPLKKEVMQAVEEALVSIGRLDRGARRELRRELRRPEFSLAMMKERDAEVIGAARKEHSRTAAALKILWQDEGGRKLIESAYSASPRQATLLLNYMGAPEIIGYLHVQRTLDELKKEGEK